MRNLNLLLAAAGVVLQTISAFTPMSSTMTKSIVQSGSFVPKTITLSNRLSKAQSSSSAASLTMKIPRIDDWKVLTNGRVMGSVRGHPTIPNGNFITTSPLDRPEIAREKIVVNTISGGKYLLGTPAYALVKNGKEQPMKIPIKELQRRARVEKDLTGEVVGDDDRQYLLSGRPQKSTSGKSNIFKAYRADENGLPVGEPVLVKISSNWEAIQREYDNYKKITQSGMARGQFVKLLDYLPVASTVTKKFRSQSALVMERGIVDLKKYIAANGKLTGRDLRDAVAAAAQCLQAVHSSRLVWTDMKTENFVVAEDGTIKGIDLESAMPVGDNPVDYSPEATPPEFAQAFLAGDGPYFVLDYNYDLWSFGMMLYEVATGKSYFDGKSPVAITKTLKSSPVIELDNVEMDDKLRDLIRQCVKLDPSSRPNMLQILLHPYFLTTGFGPISF